MQSSSNAAPVKSGDVLAAKYRVDRVLGVGGMGVVVAAIHVELDQLVALKFLHPDAATKPDLVERFVREARASVRLKSPHVAKTLDVGRMDDGRPYIVMELLEGRDLDAELRATPDHLSIEDAASFVLQACDALAEAHALGIVHRDLKPSNLFLTQGPDGRAHVKVFDFGISKFMDEPFIEGRTPSSLTKTEAVFGSPAYMSPEQMRSSRDVDERTDIWALGVILYELLTKRIPFEAQSAIEMGLKVVQDAPLPPHLLRPDIPEGLEHVIGRCLQKNLHERYADVGELATALSPFAHPRDHGIAARAVDIISSRARSGRLPPSSRSLLAPAPSQSERSIAAWGTTHISSAKPATAGLLWPILGAMAVVSAGALAVALFLASRAPDRHATPRTAPGASALAADLADAGATPERAPSVEPVAIDLDTTSHSARPAVPHAPSSSSTSSASSLGPGPRKHQGTPRASSSPAVPRASGPHESPAPDAGAFFRVRE